MIRADRETAHLKIVGTISVTRDLTETGEIKRDYWCCQLALLACVLFHSEKQSIQKNMGDVLCFYGMFVAARFQL